MSKIIQALNVSKSFGAHSILSDISLIVNASDRLALIGANGAGKTTLIKILLNLETADAGLIHRESGVEIAHLPQELSLDLEGPITINNYLSQVAGNLKEIEAEMQQLEVAMAEEIPTDTLQITLLRYGDLQELFHKRGGYALHYRFEEILQGLGLAEVNRERSLISLSGGEQRRVALAALLLRSPDLLILDEPTNHLDLEALGWLENYLADYPNALLVISHERDFLDRVTNGIVELQGQTLTYFAGNYADYLQERNRRDHEQLVAYETHKAEIKELYSYIKSQTFASAAPRPPKDRNMIAYNGHGESVAKTRGRQIRQAKGRLEELLTNPVERPPRRAWASFQLKPEPLTSQKVLEATGISKSFDEKCLFSDLSLSLHKGDRIALVGPNGSGKSTLMKILCGLVVPDAGTVKVAPNARLAYVSQAWDGLSMEETLLEAYSCAKGGGDEGDLRAELFKYGLFTGSDVFRSVRSLSSGMRQKLKLAIALVQQPNVLILDEPTNHLDLLSIESLEKALSEYQGSLLLVSHDRRFVERLTTHKWELD